MFRYRRWKRIAVLAAALSLVMPSLALSESAEGSEDISVAELMAPPGDLPEIALGAPDAKVTIVEFASLSCSHCASFHRDILPEVKTKYIDTGRVRLIMRDYPGDARALVASMLVRCLPNEKAGLLLSALFTQQKQWAFVKGNPLPILLELAKVAGLTETSFNTCLGDERLFKTITKYARRARHAFGIHVTPTFFVNGNRMQTMTTLEAFDRAIAEAEGRAGD